MRKALFLAIFLVSFFFLQQNALAYQIFNNNWNFTSPANYFLLYDSLNALNVSHNDTDNTFTFGNDNTTWNVSESIVLTPTTDNIFIHTNEEYNASMFIIPENTEVIAYLKIKVNDTSNLNIENSFLVGYQSYTEVTNEGNFSFTDVYSSLVDYGSTNYVKKLLYIPAVNTTSQLYIAYEIGINDTFIIQPYQSFTVDVFRLYTYDLKDTLNLAFTSTYLSQKCNGGSESGIISSTVENKTVKVSSSAISSHPGGVYTLTGGDDAGIVCGVYQLDHDVYIRRISAQDYDSDGLYHKTTYVFSRDIVVGSGSYFFLSNSAIFDKVETSDIRVTYPGPILNASGYFLDFSWSGDIKSTNWTDINKFKRTILLNSTVDGNQFRFRDSIYNGPYHDVFELTSYAEEEAEEEIQNGTITDVVGQYVGDAFGITDEAGLNLFAFFLAIGIAGAVAIALARIGASTQIAPIFIIMFLSAIIIFIVIGWVNLIFGVILILLSAFVFMKFFMSGVLGGG